MFGLMRKSTYLQNMARIYKQIDSLEEKNADLRSALSDSEHRNRRLREQLKKGDEEPSQCQEELLVRE